MKNRHGYLLLVFSLLAAATSWHFGYVMLSSICVSFSGLAAGTLLQTKFIRRQEMKASILTALMSLVLVILCSSCASNPYRVQELQTEMQRKEKLSGDMYIGIKDQMMIVQKKTLISEELRDLQIKVYEMEANLYGGPRYLDNNGLWGVLRNCQVKLADPKNGGEAKLSYIEPRDYVVPEQDFTQIGVDEKGDMVLVTEEFVKDRIARFKQYKHVLEKRTEEMETKNKQCDLAVKAQQIRQVASQGE